MNTTYDNKSQAIYKRAMDLAAEKIAFHQNKIEESKSLFSLCERLLGDLGEKTKNSSVKNEIAPEADSKRPTRRKPISILHAMLPYMSSKPQKSEEIVKKAGVSIIQFRTFTNYYRKYLKITPSGFVPNKDYSLNSRGLAAKKRLKDVVPFASSRSTIEECIKNKYASMREIVREARLSKSSVTTWLRKNQSVLKIKLVPSDLREGWSIKAYKLK